MLGGHVGDNGDEFIAGIASQEVVLAQLALNQAGDFAQHSIAETMSKRVVNELEVVEVEHDQLEWSSGALGARDFFFETKMQAARIRQTGKGIRVRVRFSPRMIHGVRE